jgi:transposase InsO family protein
VKLLRQLGEPTVEGSPRRGYAGQRHERERERIVRGHAVAVSAGMVAQGQTWAQSAACLHLSERTLRDWRHDGICPCWAARPLGRPILVASRAQRNAVFELLEELGPGIGLATLRAAFPGMARAALDDFLRRYRRVWRKLHQQSLFVLHWPVVGRVWAIDFHGPRPAVDGLYPDLLAVRDLASGQQLLWLPVADATATTVIEALRSLFAEYSPPLVLKSDNGSAFGAAAVQELLAQRGVKNLFSPPHMPRYNGSIEAGIGSLTSRTEQRAARRGYPGDWTWADATAARLEANATARPRGLRGPTPDELWAGRTPIPMSEREAFQQTATLRFAEIAAASKGRPLHLSEEMHRRAMDRQAIRRALEEHGYLYFTRRRIPIPIRRRKAASIM